MHLDTRIATIALPRPTELARARNRDRFFVGIAIAAAASVLLGFARTYYLKAFFPTLSFSSLFHIHGALFTAWMLLLVVQASLVVSRRTVLHRRVGWIGLSLMVAMVVTGTLVSIAGARGQGPVGVAVQRGELAWAPVPPLETLLLNNLAAMLLFGVFASAGLAYRHRPDAHKRFMVLATIVLLPSAIGRGAITILGAFHPALALGGTALFVSAMVVHDWRSRRRVHGVTLWAGLALLLSFPGRMALAKTELWLSAAAWLIR